MVDQQDSSMEFSSRGLEDGLEGNDNKVVYYYSRKDDQQQQQLLFSHTLLILRTLTFGLSLAALVLMVTNSYGVEGSSSKAVWHMYDAYRYVLAANAIVAIYSLAEALVALCSILKRSMFLPEAFAVWFDYGHDQGFAYLLFSASSAGTALAQNLRNGDIKILVRHSCSNAGHFCGQAEVAIALGFAAFFMIAVSSLLSGYRLARWMIRRG